MKIECRCLDVTKVGEVHVVRLSPLGSDGDAVRAGLVMLDISDPDVVTLFVAGAHYVVECTAVSE